MSGALIFTVIIVIAIYFYMRRTAKRSRAADIDSIKQYHNQYMRRNSRLNRRNHTSGQTYRSYVTKFNSTEDYRERRGR